MEFDLRKAINAISDVVQNRPIPLREFDQIYMKVADMVIQAEYVARVFDSKDVVFVGDGDGIALSAALLKAQNVINYGPKSITLLDFDERIVNSVRRFGEKLYPKIEISAYLYNVAEALPQKHFGMYDGFYINPPWGASNSGESVIAFFERGSQATKEKSGNQVLIVMQKIDSKHAAPPEIAKQYSDDGVNWQPIPKGIEVRGSRYALVLDELRVEEFDLALGELQVGVGPSRGRKADKYLIGQVDKGCFHYKHRELLDSQNEQVVKHIELVARVKEPYAVLLKN